MSVKPGPDPEPCPCDACDEFAGMPDSYCITCQHFDCSYNECKCPPAQNSENFCDVCNEQKDTVKGHPSWDGDRICGDCHPSGSLPDNEEWWDPEDLDDTGRYPDRCRCGDKFGFKNTASCKSCGYIPEENRW